MPVFIDATTGHNKAAAQTYSNKKVCITKLAATQQPVDNYKHDDGTKTAAT